MNTDLEISRYLATLVEKIRSTQFSADERSTVRQHLLDAIAAAFIGCRTSTFAELAALCPPVARTPTLRSAQDGAPTARGCGYPGSGNATVHPLDAAMLWSFAINGSVFEDGSREGACHSAAVVVPVLMALAAGKTWEDIDRAAVAGFDVMIRLARAGNPAFTRKGFHPTAITAPFGAAAAAAILLGLNAEQTQHALCMAAMGGAGLMASFKSGETQPLQVACSVRNGVMAAMMAAAGQAGYPRVFEEGFFPAYLGSQPTVPVDKPLDYEYAIKGAYLKPYPGCRHMHASLDAMGKVLDKTKVAAAQIASIKVRTYKVAIETEIHTLNSRGDAYFNLAYAIAARAVLGRNDWESFSEKHFTNPDILALMKKVTIVVDPEVDACYPGQRGSIVEVRTNDDKLHCAQVMFALGEPENPLPGAIIEDKLRRAGEGFLSDEGIQRLAAVLDVAATATPTSLFAITTENVSDHP